MSRVEAKTSRYARAPSTEREEAQRAAETAVRRENELMWAYYRTTDRTQREIAETVIADRDQRPTQSAVSRIVRELDEEIPFTEIESLGGWQPFMEEDRGPVPDERVELLRDHIARLLVVEDMSARLTGPEIEATNDDAPEFMRPLNFAASEVKRRESSRRQQAGASAQTSEPVTKATNTDD